MYRLKKTYSQTLFSDIVKYWFASFIHTQSSSGERCKCSFLNAISCIDGSAPRSLQLRRTSQSLWVWSPLSPVTPVFTLLVWSNLLIVFCWEVEGSEWCGPKEESQETLLREERWCDETSDVRRGCRVFQRWSLFLFFLSAFLWVAVFPFTPFRWTLSCSYSNGTCHFLYLLRSSNLCWPAASSSLTWHTFISHYLFISA